MAQHMNSKGLSSSNMVFDLPDELSFLTEPYSSNNQDTNQNCNESEQYSPSRITQDDDSLEGKSSEDNDSSSENPFSLVDEILSAARKGKLKANDEKPKETNPSVEGANDGLAILDSILSGNMEFEESEEDKNQNLKTPENNVSEIEKLLSNARQFSKKEDVKKEEHAHPFPLQRNPLPMQVAPQPMPMVPQPMHRALQPMQRAPLQIPRAPQPIHRPPQPMQRPPHPIQRAILPTPRAPQPMHQVPHPMQRVPLVLNDAILQAQNALLGKAPKLQTFETSNTTQNDIHQPEIQNQLNKLNKKANTPELNKKTDTPELNKKANTPELNKKASTPAATTGSRGLCGIIASLRADPNKPKPKVESEVIHVPSILDRYKLNKSQNSSKLEEPVEAATPDKPLIQDKPIVQDQPIEQGEPHLKGKLIQNKSNDQITKNELSISNIPNKSDVINKTVVASKPEAKKVVPLLGKSAAKKRLMSYSSHYSAIKPVKPAKGNVLEEEENDSNNSNSEAKATVFDSIDEAKAEKEIKPTNKKAAKLSNMESIRTQETKIKEALGLKNLSFVNMDNNHIAQMALLLDNPDSVKKLQLHSKNMDKKLQKFIKEVEEPLLELEKREEELKKQPKKRIPKSWDDFKRDEFSFDELRHLYKRRSYSRSSSRSRSRSRNRSHSRDRRSRSRSGSRHRSRSRSRERYRHSYKNRSMHSVDVKRIAKHGGFIEFPAKLIKYTNTRPSICYSINPDKYSRHYDNRRYIIDSSSREMRDEFYDFWDLDYIKDEAVDLEYSQSMEWYEKEWEFNLSGIKEYQKNKLPVPKASLNSSRIDEREENKAKPSLSALIDSGPESDEEQIDRNTIREGSSSLYKSPPAEFSEGLNNEYEAFMQMLDNGDNEESKKILSRRTSKESRTESNVEDMKPSKETKQSKTDINKQQKKISKIEKEIAKQVKKDERKKMKKLEKQMKKEEKRLRKLVKKSMKERNIINPKEMPNKEKNKDKKKKKDKKQKNKEKLKDKENKVIGDTENIQTEIKKEKRKKDKKSDKFKDSPLSNNDSLYNLIHGTETEKENEELLPITKIKKEKPDIYSLMEKHLAGRSSDSSISPIKDNEKNQKVVDNLDSDYDPADPCLSPSLLDHILGRNSKKQERSHSEISSKEIASKQKIDKTQSNSPTMVGDILNIAANFPPKSNLIDCLKSRSPSPISNKNKTSFADQFKHSKILSPFQGKSTKQGDCSPSTGNRSKSKITTTSAFEDDEPPKKTLKEFLSDDDPYQEYENRKSKSGHSDDSPTFNYSKTKSDEKQSKSCKRVRSPNLSIIDVLESEAKHSKRYEVSPSDTFNGARGKSDSFKGGEYSQSDSNDDENRKDQQSDKSASRKRRSSPSHSSKKDKRRRSISPENQEPRHRSRSVSPINKKTNKGSPKPQYESQIESYISSNNSNHSNLETKEYYSENYISYSPNVSPMRKNDPNDYNRKLKSLSDLIDDESPVNSPKRLSLDERLKQEHGLDIEPEVPIHEQVPPNEWESGPTNVILPQDNSNDVSKTTQSSIVQSGNCIEVVPSDKAQNVQIKAAPTPSAEAPDNLNSLLDTLLGKTSPVAGQAGGNVVSSPALEMLAKMDTSFMGMAGSSSTVAAIVSAAMAASMPMSQLISALHQHKMITKEQEQQLITASNALALDAGAPSSTPPVPPSPGVDVAALEKKRAEMAKKARKEKREQKRQAREQRREMRRQHLLEQRRLQEEQEALLLQTSQDNLSDDEELVREAMSEVPNMGSPIPDYEISPDEDEEEMEKKEKKKYFILPPAEKGILLSPNYRHRNDHMRKSVKFADGILPGEGTEPSGGEEIHSPPPPSGEDQEPKKTKTKTLKKKRKMKIKLIKTYTLDQDDQDSPPPPPPSTTPPTSAFVHHPQYDYYTANGEGKTILYTKKNDGSNNVMQAPQPYASSTGAMQNESPQENTTHNSPSVLGPVAQSPNIYHSPMMNSNMAASSPLANNSTAMMYSPGMYPMMSPNMVNQIHPMQYMMMNGQYAQPPPPPPPTQPPPTAGRRIN